MAAFSQAHNAKVLNKPAQPLDMLKQAHKLSGLCGKDAISKPLKPATQDRYRRPKFVRYRGIPENLIARNPLQLAGERVEVLCQKRRFSKRAISHIRPRTEVSSCYTLDAVSNRVQWQQDSL